MFKCKEEEEEEAEEPPIKLSPEAAMGIKCYGPNFLSLPNHLTTANCTMGVHILAYALESVVDTLMVQKVGPLQHMSCNACH